MREIEAYFRKTDVWGRGSGMSRLWPIEIYSDGIRERVAWEQSIGFDFDEWGLIS